MTPNIHIKQDQNRKLHQNFDSLCWSIYSIKQYIGSFKSSNHQVIKFLFVSNFITHFILSHHIFSRTNLFILAICSKVNRFYFQRYFHRLILSNLFCWYLIQMIFLFEFYFFLFYLWTSLLKKVKKIVKTQICKLNSLSKIWGIGWIIWCKEMKCSCEWFRIVNWIERTIYDLWFERIKNKLLYSILRYNVINTYKIKSK